ncbi:MAG: hypothetical protein JWL64_1297 [Frankiales bacterium]|nr:hypothetical protein [Frankiales bacterium]
MTAPRWRSIRRPAVFAERHGFVLLDPQRLEQLAPRAVGHDLLGAMEETELGEIAARTGVAVPITGIDAGAYDLAVHAVDDPIRADPPAVVSGGWVLDTPTGHLLLGRLAQLRRWDPLDLDWGWAPVPPGCYSVEVRGYPPGPGGGSDAGPLGGPDGTYAWALRPTAALPWFTADLDT